MFKIFLEYKAGYKEIALIKTSAFTFALLFAKLWSPVLSLDWYWYFIIMILAAYKPVRSAFLIQK